MMSKLRYRSHNCRRTPRVPPSTRWSRPRSCSTKKSPKTTVGPQIGAHHQITSANQQQMNMRGDTYRPNTHPCMTHLSYMTHPACMTRTLRGVVYSCEKCARNAPKIREKLPYLHDDLEAVGPTEVRAVERVYRGGLYEAAVPHAHASCR